jgi:hypothetical protein
VARYTAGQFYLPHFDAFDLRTGPGRECVNSGGQRVATVLIYLNDVPEGACVCARASVGGARSGACAVCEGTGARPPGSTAGGAANRVAS